MNTTRQHRYDDARIDRIEFWDPGAARFVPRVELDTAKAKLAVMAAVTKTQNGDEQAAAKFYSPMEALLLAAFWHVGLAPDLQHPFPPYTVDFYFPVEHVAVEVDGKGWHDSIRDHYRDSRLRRDRDVVVRRFTGGDVYNRPIVTARAVQGTVEWINSHLHLVKRAA